MQVSDMKSLRTIFSSHKHFLISKNPKSHIPSLISCRSLLNPKSSFFHSTSNLNTESPADNAPENGKKRNVWTHYDPVTSKLITQRVKSSRGDGNEAESSSGDESHLGLSKISNGVEAFSDDKTFGSVKKVNLGSGSSKKTKKTKVCWVCSDCGHSMGQWWGICRSCDKVGTLKEFSEGEDNDGGKTCGYEVSERVMRSWLPNQASEIYPMKLTDVNRGINNRDWRIPLDGRFGNEVARVLGGGLVPGSLVLVGGDPGVGKSTLLLQIAAILAEGCGNGEPKPAPVVYVSGEESVEQIGNRADRLKIGTDHLFLYSSTDIEDILEKIQRLSPRALIIDSIQTVYLKGVAGSTGGIVQVKECTSALLRFSKKTGIPILLIGHVNKNGEVAGPRVLEHIVDVVLYLEGEKCSSHRLLRPVKNRFGSTDELGVFEMLPSGLQTVSNPSRMFLREHDSNSEFLAGLAVAVIMDGTRTFLVEIQALCVSKSSASRHVNGIQPSKADMIISVLMKQAGLKLQENVIFLNVVSGVTLTETAGDLAIAMAICSSFLEFPIPYDMAFIGEIGLGGELRMVSRMEKRINTVAKLGFKRCVIPKSAEDCLGLLDLGEMKLIGCINLKDAINSVYMVRDEATRLQSSVG